MRDRAHEIAARAEARDAARRRAESQRRQAAEAESGVKAGAGAGAGSGAEAEGAGGSITLEEEWRLSAAQDVAYRRGRSGR